MAIYKYIHWRPDLSTKDGMHFANVHILVGYNQGTIAAFRSMADDLRETFPQAADEEISAGSVHESPFCKNFAIIAWNAHIPEGAYPEWRQTHHGRAPGYRW